MKKVVEIVDLRNLEKRLLLATQKKPYWMALNEGEHLGYYRGSRVRKWLARYRRPAISSKYREFTIAEADDYADADGSKILSLGKRKKLLADGSLSLAKTIIPVQGHIWSRMH
jgi:hypothetical protein